MRSHKEVMPCKRPAHLSPLAALAGLATVSHMGLCDKAGGQHPTDFCQPLQRNQEQRGKRRQSGLEHCLVKMISPTYPPTL